jgi:hypothetical protein
LASGVVAIAAASGVLAAWAVLVVAIVSVPLGLLGIVLAAVLACVDAEFATPTRLDVTSDGIVLGYWHRDRAFEPHAVVVSHDVRRNRCSIRRRGKRRVLARFRADREVVRAFVAARVEIVSR